MSPPRVIACCGAFVSFTGAERLTFEILGVLAERGAKVHCIVNTWDNKNAIAAAERIGATWSTGYYWHRFDRHTRSPIKLAKYASDILMTSLGLLRDSRRFKPTHIFIPEFMTVLRNAPALAWLRWRGIKAILRLPDEPAQGGFYRRLWGRVLPRFVDLFAPNSRFTERELLATGAPSAKIVRIPNAAQKRAVAPEIDAAIVEFAKARRTILFVGQLAPYKGAHHFVEAALALLAEGRDIHALLVGAFDAWPDDLVEYQRGLVEQVRAAGAEERVRFAGYRENVPGIMRAAWLLAAPFGVESFGNVVLEAKSVGLPQAIFDSGGLPELVEHDATGWICDGHDTAALLRGLRRYLDDPAARERASAACIEFFGRPGCDYARATFEAKWLEAFDWPEAGEPGKGGQAA